jgi:uncharacterized membrane protein
MDFFDKFFSPDKFLSSLFSDSGSGTPSHTKILKSLKAKADAKRTGTERLADFMTKTCGSFTFLLLNALWFFVWVFLNTGILKGVVPFDPYPFQFLTMVVSLEAIILAIFVLISQNRGTKIDDVREELHLQINMISEKEITKIVELLKILLEKNGVDLSGDKELQHILKPLNTNRIEKVIEDEIR